MGRGAEALEHYRRSLALRAKLAAANPANTEWQRDVSLSLDRVGNVLVADGRTAEALDAYRAGLTIAEKLVAADPGNTVAARSRRQRHQSRQCAGQDRTPRRGAGVVPPRSGDRREA